MLVRFHVGYPNIYFEILLDIKTSSNLYVPIAPAMKFIFILTAFLFHLSAFPQKIFLRDSTASCMAKWEKHTHGRSK